MGSRRRLFASLPLFAVGGTLALAEFINATMHVDGHGNPVGTASMETLLVHCGLFVLGWVLIAAGFLLATPEGK